jgi:hypothetical protein
MSEHPLGNPNPEPTPSIAEPSIVDTILNLDELLSADVRRAEKTARFCIRPDLEADIDDLNGQLEAITDERGNPLGDGPDRTIGEHTTLSVATDLAHQLRAKQAEYAAAFRSVRMRQMPDDDWDAFETKWKKALDAGAPYPKEFWDELIVASSHTPKISAPQVSDMRTKLGRPAMNELGLTAWDVNTKAGVSLPKSPISSVVLRREALAKS